MAKQKYSREQREAAEAVLYGVLPEEPKDIGSRAWWRWFSEAAHQELPAVFVESTSGTKNGNGYDTTGYKYIACVERLNWILGIGGWSSEFQEVSYKAERGHTIAVLCTIKILDGERVLASRTAAGGKRHKDWHDARKGAETNSMKKCLALFGIGWRAYAGKVDDDSVPAEIEELKSKRVNEQRGEPATGVRPQSAAGVKTADNRMIVRDLIAKMPAETYNEIKNGWNKDIDPEEVLIERLRAVITSI